MRFAFAQAFLLVSVASSSALVGQPLPADCSALKTMPTGPVAASVQGSKFIPKVIVLKLAGEMESRNQKWDAYELQFHDDKYSAERRAELTMLAPKGKRIDGGTFLMKITKGNEPQHSVAPGLPQIQGFSFKGPDTSYSHVFYEASLRLTFGQRNGDSISGSICFVMPKGQQASFDKKPIPYDSSVIGTFQATIEQ